MNPPHAEADALEAHEHAAGSRNVKRHMSINGKRASIGKTMIITLVAELHELNMLDMLKTPAVDSLAAEIRPLRYGAKLSEIVFLIWSRVELTVVGQETSSIEENSFETIVSTGGACVNKIGFVDIFSIFGRWIRVWGCAVGQ